MVPPELSNYFLATAGAGAALIGLLFVAVSIAPEQIVTRRAPMERQAVAASTFTALLNAFFISLGALIPGSLGTLALLMSTLGLLNSLTLGGHLLRHPKNWQNFVRRVFLILVSLAIYGAEFYYALRLTITSSAADSAYTLAALLLAVYGIGLIRAWELLGVNRFGLLSWLNPLYDVNESLPIANEHLIDSMSGPSHEGKTH
ncbi:MAG TPA: hypothetical protein VFB12_05410 [Ktedonobacteraceae bacterium]|nr:hypothetical protein [Ktedonobacteraceae bacterium]